ncbi:hypothetical protein EV421DRAFT_1729477 [Armillaria borealis]|uniref:Uncharacterized protein n=1 Tax=Armillaria borealis TaxID=47425 RepID=A0AA39K9C5_9AGAR|nr:hypothetical protein EV421DRAFT_1729477 [Armillaria borealis]
MADPYYLLRAAMAKAPSLWDTDLYDSLSTHTVAQQVEEAHTLLTTYRNTFTRPYSDLIERFFATASDAALELPDRSFQEHWKVWLYGPTMVKEYLKAGRFTSKDIELLKAPSPAPMPSSSAQRNPKKRKTQRSPSPPANSGKTRPSKTESQVKVEKPARKRSKHDSSSSKVKESEHDSPPSTKASTSKVKTELLALTKEGSVTTEKSQVCGRGHKPAKIPIVEMPTVPRSKMQTPPPTVISEDTHVDVRGRSPTPVTAEYMLDRILTDLPTLSALRLPHQDAADFVEMHDHNFLAADPFSHVEGSHDTDALVKFARQYPVGRCLMIDMGLLAEDDGELQCVADPQLRHYYPRPLVVHSETTPEPPLPAFTVQQPEPITKKPRRGKEEEDEETADGDHVAQVLEEDELPSSPARPVKHASSSAFYLLYCLKCHAQKGPFLLFLPDGRKAYPNPLALDMGIPPEQFRSLLVADHYILLRQARASHPSLVDMNTLATYLQPKIKSMLDSIHPFLFTHSQAAHEAYFPKDVDLVIIRFLATLTALANNLSLAFQSISWEAWKVDDSIRMFKLLGYLKPSFDPMDVFPGEVCAPALPSLPSKRNRFQVTPEHVFHQGLRWEHFQGAASAAWFANLCLVFLLFSWQMVSPSFWPEDMPLPFSWKDLPGLLQADHYFLLRLARTRYPQILDFNILVNWCQPEVATLINHVHPFLLAHVKHFPDDVDILALRFLMTVTALANNLGPCFVDPDWSPWKVQDPRRLVIGLQNFMSPFPHNLHFPDSQDPVIL